MPTAIDNACARLDALSQSALAATSCAVLITDAAVTDNPIIFANAAFSALCGYDIAEIIGRNCRFLQGVDTDPATCADIRAAISAGAGIRRDILNYRKDGTSFWNDLTINPIRDAAGQVTGFIGIQYQSDALHNASSEKAEAESKFANVADRMPGYIYQRVMRTDGSIDPVYISPSLWRLLGVKDGAARDFYDYVHPDDLAALNAAIRGSAADLSAFHKEFRLVSTSGSVHWVRSEATPHRTANGEIIWEGLAVEVSAEKRWQSEVANQALRDSLTGLLTRAAWRQALAMKMSAVSFVASRCGVLCIDITRLNALNEKFGQQVGDATLREVGQRLMKLAESVGGVAARLGGNEFAIMAPGCVDEAALLLLTDSASHALALPMLIGTQPITIETSIGASLCTVGEPGTDAGDDQLGELMKQAELALRWAKLQGRNAHILYSRERDDRFQNRPVLARTLEQAIADNELTLHYQPLVDLASGRIISAEALVRWDHPLLGMQRPDLFIPLAESSGLILPLGLWVLDEALRQRKAWREDGISPPSIAINVSGNQLLDPGFVPAVQNALRRANADAADFEIELTEGLMIEPSMQVMESLISLREMGFTITIDDFGAGHASFRYLRDFPVDKLKIDQLFIRQLVLESTDALIIRAIISLARSLGIRCVAEGIETEMQRDFLLREGCEVGQGALFAMPLNAKDFAARLANQAKVPPGQSIF